jgi:hypothetical protein
MRAIFSKIASDRFLLFKAIGFNLSNSNRGTRVLTSLVSTEGMPFVDERRQQRKKWSANRLKSGNGSPLPRGKGSRVSPWAVPTSVTKW